MPRGDEYLITGAIYGAPIAASIVWSAVYLVRRAQSPRLHRLALRVLLLILATIVLLASLLVLVSNSGPSGPNAPPPSSFFQMVVVFVVVIFGSLLGCLGILTLVLRQKITNIVGSQSTRAVSPLAEWLEFIPILFVLCGINLILYAAGYGQVIGGIVTFVGALLAGWSFTIKRRKRRRAHAS